MNNLIPIEFKNERVITTELLAEVYGTDARNISNNFNRNKTKFIEGKHYYLLQGTELKSFKANHLLDESLKFVSKLYLWTERGANRHCKILDTDKAWEQFDNLEETYFRVKEDKILLNQLSPELQMFKQIFDNVARQELEQQRLNKEIAATKEEIQNIRETIVINPKSNWRKETNNVLNRIGFKTKEYNKVKNRVYKALEERARCNLSTRLKNLKDRALKAGIGKSNVSQLNNLDVIENDTKLKEIYIGIVKEIAIKNNVSM